MRIPSEACRKLVLERKLEWGMDHGRDGWRLGPCTVLQAWVIGLRLGKKEPERIRAPEKVASGFYALALSLSRTPASKHRKGQ